MSGPQVFPVDSFETVLDGIKTEIGVDYDSVTITAGGLGVRLTRADAERFAHAFVQAAWLAGYHERIGHER